MRVARCPGTFDPVTNGHLDIITRTARLFDRVVVGVSRNPAKRPLFTVEERMLMISDSIADIKNVEVVSFDCLLVELARKIGSCSIVKGLRAISDFEFEFQMAQFNYKMDDGIETFFLMANSKYTFLSSSGIKEVAAYGGVVNGFVPELVAKRRYERFRDSNSGE